MDKDEQDNLRSRLSSMSNRELQSCYRDVATAAVQARCLSMLECEDLEKVVKSAEVHGMSRNTRESQMHMLIDRIRAVPGDDRPREPIAADTTNAAAGLPQTGLSRTGKYDFRAGDHVEVHGLSSRPEANGAYGIIVQPGYDAARGRCFVRARREGDRPPFTLAVRPCNLRLTRHKTDESPVVFVRPRGDIEQRTVGWCRTNGFDNVSDGQLWAGPWWDGFTSAERQSLLQHVALNPLQASFNAEAEQSDSADLTTAFEESEDGEEEIEDARYDAIIDAALASGGDAADGMEIGTTTNPSIQAGGSNIQHVDPFTDPLLMDEAVQHLLTGAEDLFGNLAINDGRSSRHQTEAGEMQSMKGTSLWHSGDDELCEQLQPVDEDLFEEFLGGALHGAFDEAVPLCVECEPRDVQRAEM